MTEPVKRMAQSPGAIDDAPADGSAACAPARAPLSFVVDDESSMRHFLSLILHGGGIDTEEFADGASFRQAMNQGRPDLVFLNVGIESVDAIESVIALGKHGYFGFVQLMSNRGSAVLEHVKCVGTQHGLQMLPVLKKPFETSAIIAIMHELKLGHPTPSAARIELNEAIKTGGSNSGTSPRSTSARSSFPASKPSPAAAIRNSAFCRRAHSCRARLIPSCLHSPSRRWPARCRPA
jgi:CheY-like chemotaxis protein